MENDRILVRIDFGSNIIIESILVEAKDDDSARASSTSGREPRSHQGAEKRDSAPDAADGRQRLQRQRLRSGVPPLADGCESPHADDRPI